MGEIYVTGRWVAALWTWPWSPVTLGTLGGRWSEAYGVSADGQIVVGEATLPDGWGRAFRWTVSRQQMENLGTLGGRFSLALGISADGRVIVGKAENSRNRLHAFRWTAEGGMEDLNVTYAHLLTNGSFLGEARAVSPDGRYIVGHGYNTATARGEAFLLDTAFPPRGDVDRNGCVDDADLLRVLFEFGAQGYRNEDLNWDGTIDDADLLVVLFNFGGGC